MNEDDRPRSVPPARFFEPTSHPAPDSNHAAGLFEERAQLGGAPALGREYLEIMEARLDMARPLEEGDVMYSSDIGWLRAEPKPQR